MTTLTLKPAEKPCSNDYILEFQNPSKGISKRQGVNGIRLTETNFLYAIFKMISLVWGDVKQIETSNGRREYLWVRNTEYGNQALKKLYKGFNGTSQSERYSFAKDLDGVWKGRDLFSDEWQFSH